MLCPCSDTAAPNSRRAQHANPGELGFTPAGSAAPGVTRLAVQAVFPIEQYDNYSRFTELQLNTQNMMIQWPYRSRNPLYCIEFNKYLRWRGEITLG